MTTDNRPNLANEPVAFPPNPTQTPAKPGLTEKEGSQNVDRADKIADHLAHKGAQTEQGFDNENSKLFSK
jgi:hypothetical protein